MPSVCFRVKSQSDIEDAWNELIAANCEPLYSSEDAEGNKEIVANVSIDVDTLLLSHIASYEPIDLSYIDWEGQWALHGLDYRDGYVHLPVKDKQLRLEPGPGFGDMSHPTTRLMVKMMGTLIEGKDVLDIGCGSGVLSLVACALGARSVFGIDIDEGAIRHSRQNAILNGMEKNVRFGFAKDIDAEAPKKLFVVMNMIQSEQIEAWQSVKHLHASCHDFIVSGILQEDRKKYLAQVKKWGWKQCNEIEEEGWLCFHFENTL